jgi:hypothetical protein
MVGQLESEEGAQRLSSSCEWLSLGEATAPPDPSLFLMDVRVVAVAKFSIGLSEAGMLAGLDVVLSTPVWSILLGMFSLMPVDAFSAAFAAFPAAFEAAFAAFEAAVTTWYGLLHYANLIRWTGPYCFSFQPT